MSGLMPFNEAIAHIRSTLPICSSSETVPLSNALNRILAQDIVAQINVPPAANSAMDGYAVRIDDLQTNLKLTVSQRIAAGTAPVALAPDSCARIFTGAEIPDGANAVIMQEKTQLEDGKVVFDAIPKLGDNIRPAGQDIAQGNTIFTSGKRLTAIDIGVLASIGTTEVKVYKPLRVGILTTGDELQVPGSPLAAGQIYNSNGPLLEALVTTSGHQVSLRSHAADSVEATELALKTLSEQSDIIISSGGVSVGEEDHVKATIEKNGQLHLWKIAIKPGKPLVFAKVYDTPFLGLPGNPSSTLVTFHLFARLALAKSAGEQLTLPKPYPVKCDFIRKANQSRDEFLRVHIDQGIATPHTQQSSGALLAASCTDGYLHVPAQTEIKPQMELNFYPFSSF